MAQGHPDLPRAAPLHLSKQAIFSTLHRIDQDERARARVLRMENDFRTRISTHLRGLPAQDAQFRKFYTSPFVLMFYSRQQNYLHVSQIEHDLVPAKVFSSMETSAGRMVELVTLPIYGWTPVGSAMHTHDSLLDGKKLDCQPGTFVGATLKSGPRTLNDEMAQNIGEQIVTNAASWAVGAGAQRVEFTYGTLYGTQQQSNKKDWHILRHIEGHRSRTSVVSESHVGAWEIAYSDGPLHVTAAVRIGIAWWTYLGGPDTWIELSTALIRACVDPGPEQTDPQSHIIRDLGSILDLTWLDSSFNVALLQKSQYEWLLFLARHFCDGLSP